MIQGTKGSLIILGFLTGSVLCASLSPAAQEDKSQSETVVNRVLSLDGDGDSVRVADSQSLHSFTEAITIEVWFNASSFHTEDGMINSLVRKNIAPEAENFLLRFRNMNSRPGVQMGLGELGTLSASFEFAVNKWYHLAGTYDGGAITVLVNGVAVASQNASGRLRIDQSDLSIGKGDPVSFSSGEYFHGQLDEIRLWNVGRSPEQIQAAMNAPLTGGEEGLVAYWNFDDGAAKDLSGHGNDGILNGDAKIVESARPASVAAQEPNKLLAWWKFENDVNDSAGVNHGTIQGDPVYVDGKIGRAISFDGNDCVDLGNPDSLNFGAGDWTISAWIKTTQSGIEDLNKGTVFAEGGDGGGGIRVALAVNEGQVGSITLSTDDDEYKVQAISRTAVNDGAWHHIAAMRNASQLRVYVDGALDGGDYLPGQYDLSGASQHNAYIGAITDHANNSLYKYFVGAIDEVCIIGGAIDPNGVRALYSGQDPATVAKTAIIARAAPRPRPQPVTGDGKRIEGDWRIVSDQISRQVTIEFRTQPDGTLSGTIVPESPDAAAPAMLLNNVVFSDGTLSFEGGTPPGVFEGKMKEDGATIEGQFRQQGQTMSLALKRIVAASSEAAPVIQEQLPGPTGGTHGTATALILALVLVGVVAVIALFLLKASIRR